MTVAMDTEIRPDRSGPRNLAVLLMIGSILVLLYGYADLNSHRIGLSDAEAEDFVLNPSLSGEDNSTIEDYRAFEDDARANSAFLVRSVSLLVAGSLVLIGGAMLFRLKRVGAYLSVAGASIGLIGGVLGSIMIHRSAETYLGDALSFTYEAWAYICGAMMGLCLAMAALPLLNLRARMALEPVRLVVGEEAE